MNKKRGRLTKHHSLRRTTPKGERDPKWVCVNCGESINTLEKAKTECANLRRVTEKESMMEALTGRVN